MPQNEFRRIVEDLPLPAYLFDGNTRRFVAANALYCKLVGYTEEELIALPWPRIMAEEHVQPALAAMAAETPLEQPTAWAFKRKDGSVVIVHTLYRSMHLNRRNGQTLDVLFAAVVGFPGQTIRRAEKVFGS
jgi:PAS domain S-box-containing protein